MRETTVLQAIDKRRSTKHFKSDAIPDTILNALVEAAAAAPSSWNFQPWRVVMIDSTKQKRDLASAAWNQPQIIEAPVTFVFAVSLTGWREVLPQVVKTAQAVGAWGEKMVEMVSGQGPKFQEALGDKLREYAVKDAMIAATQVALAAESLGLGSCFMNGWSEDAVKKVLGAANQPDIAIALLLPVGYAAETPMNPGRLARGKLFFRNSLFEPYTYKPKALRSPKETGLGLMHLPRLIDKVRLHAKGHLPGYNFLTSGFDKMLIQLLGVTPLAFREAVQAAKDDEGVFQWLTDHAKMPSPAEREAFNQKLASIGPSDAARAARFRTLLDSLDPARSELKSFVDLIDLQEGRI
jgi:nitroreductase